MEGRRWCLDDEGEIVLSSEVRSSVTRLPLMQSAPSGELKGLLALAHTQKTR
jgi:hypothetical protein